MKEILEIIGLFFWQETPFYIIKKDLDKKGYIRWWLYRKNYIMCFIPWYTVIDTTHNVGNGYDVVAQWYTKYNQVLNNKYTVTEK